MDSRAREWKKGKERKKQLSVESLFQVYSMTERESATGKEAAPLCFWWPHDLYSIIHFSLKPLFSAIWSTTCCWLAAGFYTNIKYYYDTSPHGVQCFKIVKSAFLGTAVNTKTLWNGFQYTDGLQKRTKWVPNKRLRHGRAGCRSGQFLDISVKIHIMTTPLNDATGRTG